MLLYTEIKITAFFSFSKPKTITQAPGKASNTSFFWHFNFELQILAQYWAIRCCPLVVNMLRSSGHTVSRTRDIKMSFSHNKKWKKCILLAQEVSKCSQKDFFAEHGMNNEWERVNKGYRGTMSNVQMVVMFGRCANAAFQLSKIVRSRYPRLGYS